MNHYYIAARSLASWKISGESAEDAPGGHNSTSDAEAAFMTIHGSAVACNLLTV